MGEHRFARDYKDLIVWQRAMDLAAVCHLLAGRLPHGIRGDMATQIRRASQSIPANIAEGHSRPSAGEFLQFLGIARASLKELESHLLLLRRLGLQRQAELQDAVGLCEECSRMLTVMRRRLMERTMRTGPLDAQR